MAPTHVQDDWAEGTGVSSLSITLSGVTAGNMLFAVVCQPDGGTRAWTFSDDNGGSWSEDVTTPTPFARTIGHAPNVSSGDTEITATINVATNNFALIVGEISGADTTTPEDAADSFVETGTVSTHNCADSASIDTSADVYVLMAGGITIGGTSSYTKGANYTLLRSSATFNGEGYIVAYRTSSAALANERGTYTTGTARASQGAIASFVSAPAAAATTVTGGVIRRGKNHAVAARARGSWPESWFDPLVKEAIFAGIARSPNPSTYRDSNAKTKKSHGTFQSLSSPWIWMPEIGRWGLNLDGTGHVEIDDGAVTDAIPHLDGAFSFSFWMDMTAKGAWTGPLCWDYTNDGNAEGFALVDSTASTSSYLPNMIVTDAATETEKWDADSFTYAVGTDGLQHWTWTYDGTTARFFVDGAEQAVSSDGTGGYGSKQARIGNSFGSNVITGRMADVLIWKDKVLSPGEIYKISRRTWQPIRPRSTIVASVAAPAATTVTGGVIRRGKNHAIAARATGSWPDSWVDPLVKEAVFAGIGRSWGHDVLHNAGRYRDLTPTWDSASDIEWRWDNKLQSPMTRLLGANNDYWQFETDTRMQQTGEVTLVADIQLNGNYTTDQGVFCSMNNSSSKLGYALTFGWTANKLQWWQSGSGPVLTSTLSITDDNTRRIVVTRSGSAGDWTIKFFIDGVLDSSATTATDATGDATSVTTIGNFGGFDSWPFRGHIGTPMMFDRALSDGEAAMVSSPTWQPIRPSSRIVASVVEAAEPAFAAGIFDQIVHYNQQAVQRASNF